MMMMMVVVIWRGRALVVGTVHVSATGLTHPAALQMTALACQAD